MKDKHDCLVANPTQSVGREACMPVIRESVVVNFGSGVTGTMYRDEYDEMVKKALHKDHFKYLGFPGA